MAWGALTASQHPVAAAVPPLTAALDRRLGDDEITRRATELAILDALAQLDASVPVEVLQPSLDRWPMPTLILLGSAIGDRDALLLERFNSTGRRFEWLAMANLLLKSKPLGFAFRLLQGLHLELIVRVTDEYGRGFGSGGGSGGSADGADRRVRASASIRCCRITAAAAPPLLCAARFAAICCRRALEASRYAAE